MTPAGQGRTGRRNRGGRKSEGDGMGSGNRLARPPLSGQPPYPRAIERRLVLIRVGRFCLAEFLGIRGLLGFSFAIH